MSTRALAPLRAALFIALLLTAAGASAQTAPASSPLALASAPVAESANPPAASAAQASLLGQVSDQAGELVVNALSQIGVRYRWGGDGNGSFDCSGLVQHVYQQTVGVVLPHNAKAQSKEGVKVAQDDLQPGDLVFFKTLRRTISHVGIYIGNGQFVHAPHTGASVEVDTLNSGYWAKRFITARRLLDASVDPLSSAVASQPATALRPVPPVQPAPAASPAHREASPPQRRAHARASAAELRHGKAHKAHKPRHIRKAVKKKSKGKKAPVRHHKHKHPA